MKSGQARAIVLLAFVIFLKCKGIVASNLSSYGSEFYLAFPRNVNGAQNITFIVHTLKTTAVQFSIDAIDGNFSYTGTTTAGNPRAVPIPLRYEVLFGSFSYRRLGFHITSLETEPISVVGWSRSPFGYYSYLGLPSHTQPTNEYIYYGMSTLGHANFDSYILLVGCRNYTNVTVIPSKYANITMSGNPQLSISAYRTFVAGETNNFIIHAGQTVYMYQEYADLSGTKIIANSSLSVISGHIFSRVPVQDYDADPIATQVTPTITWGKEFLLSPHHFRPNGQFYKIIAHRNNTLIQRKCHTSAPVNTTLASGQVYNFSTVSNIYCSVVSNKPIYIAQVGVSTFYNGGSYGDPTLSTIPPIDQFLHSIEFTPILLFGTVSILIPNDQYFDNNLIYDGTTLINVTWTSIIYYPNNSIAAYARSHSATGTHNVTHSNSSGKLFISIYGWGTYGGYCYSGGMGLNPINPALPLPKISFTRELYSVTEGTSNVLIHLNRSTNYEEQVSVRVNVSPLQVDTATVGVDYTSVSAVVTFEPEQLINSITIPITNDELVESTEYFTVTLEAIGSEVLLFPITECTVEIFDNDYVQIGFSNTSLTLTNTTHLNLEVTNHHGVLQSGVSIRVLLQVQSLTGQTIPVSHFDFYNYSGSFISLLSLNDLPFSLNYNNNSTIINGRLVLDRATANVTIQPSVITVNYSSSEQHVIAPTASSVVCSSFESVPSQELLISTVYVTASLNLTTTPALSSAICSCVPATKTVFSTVHVYVPPSSVVTTVVSTEVSCPRSTNFQTATSSTVSSNYLIGSVMGYLILIIIAAVSTVGAFFCGRSTGKKRRNHHNMIGFSLTNNVNDYEGQGTFSRTNSQVNEYPLKYHNQSMPLPALPVTKEGDGDEIYDELYMDMTAQQKNEET